MTITLYKQHLSITNDLETSIEYTIHNDDNIEDVMQAFRKFLLACGYGPENVDEYIEPE